MRKEEVLAPDEICTPEAVEQSARSTATRIMRCILLTVGEHTRQRVHTEANKSSPGNKYTSYSINKGEKIVFCLRSKDTSNKLVDINTMMFVAIHELAHLMTKSVGHTPEFWTNMKYLLKKAIDIKLYVKQDFSKNPVNYCGTKITNSMYFTYMFEFI